MEAQLTECLHWVESGHSQREIAVLQTGRYAWLILTAINLVRTTRRDPSLPPPLPRPFQ